jgi:hypothetical protein
MAYRNGPKIVTDGLVLCLDAAIGKSYPGSGTTWYDLSGNGHNGTLQGNTAFSSANNGGLFCDGSGDYITLGTKNFITTDFSVLMWIKPTTATKELYLFSFGYNDSISGLLFRNLSSPYDLTAIVRYNGINSTHHRTSAQLENGKFYQIGWTRDGSTNNLYVNGESKQTFSNSTQLASCTYDIGWASSRNNTAAYHQGYIYNTMIYDKGLSSDEVTQNFNATRGRFGV